MSRSPTTQRDVALTRRELLATVPAVLATARAHGGAGQASGRPAIAAITTVYHKASHAQGIVDRFLDGHGWESRHYRPSVDVVSLYVDQTPSGDLSRDREKSHPGLKIYPTIGQALTRGGDRLAVDGVLLIGEHGRYPVTEKGQRLYPRYPFFQQIVDVFRRSGRSVPVFNDKHLSWNWEWARSMVETARTMGFPFMAGSSLPVTWRIPAVDVPFGAEIVEAVGVGYGGLDSYDFHGLEAIQCMIERRKGGETGVAAVTALRGGQVWKALAGGSWNAGGCDRELVEACLCRSFTLASPRPGYGNAYPELGQLPALAPDPMLYRIEYVDGSRASLLMLSGLVRDFTVAVRLKGEPRPVSTQMYLAGISPGQTIPNFFNPLVHHIETLFQTGKPSYPVERTLMTTGILASAIDSLHNGQARIETRACARLSIPRPWNRHSGGADAMIASKPDPRTARAFEPLPRKRIAIVTTVWHYLSHAQHMGDRFLVGYPWEGRWHRPAIDVAGLYVDQKPKGDQSAERAHSFGFEVYPTISQALRCGGPKLAVDGVLVIGEHGEYPRNQKGQILYPRYEFFREVTRVFEEDGRSVPVFNDKHLSFSFARASEMVQTARRLKFPFLAGSSLPVTWRLPPVDIPTGSVIEDALAVGVGGSDAMDFHALEALQAMVERRKGGETGVKAVQLVAGEAVWQAGNNGRWSRELLEAALSRSDTIKGLTVTDGRTQNLAAGSELPRLVERPAAYFIEYADGTRATLLMLDGAVADFTFAAKVRGSSRILSTQFLLPPNPNVAYSACLMHKVEEMIESGRAPYPVERTLLVSGVLESCLDSKVQGHRRLETPQLDVHYQPPLISQFCQR